MSTTESDSYYERSQESTGLLKNVRQPFVRKVFGVLAVQLTMTAAMIVTTQANRSFRNFQIDHPNLLFLSFFVTIATYLLLYFVRACSQKVPMNFALLGLLTLGEAFSVSAATIGYSPDIVLRAGLITAGAALLLTAHAMTTKKDVTMLGSTLFLLISCSSLAAILNFFFFRNSLLDLLIDLSSLLVTCYYMIYNVQLIVGNSSRKIGVDDYILGALMVYSEIIQLFLRLLRILEKLSKDENDKKKKRN